MKSKDIYNLKIKSALKIVRKFDWLLNSYVLDFYVEDHWGKLPQSWTSFFENVEPTELGELIVHKKLNKVVPLSLITLLKCVDIYSIERSPVKKIESDEYVENINRLQCPKLEKIFLKHVKFKKRHEILEMSCLVCEMAEDCKCSSVVDVGSGLGHLVRTLSYKHGLKTLGIEAQESLVTNAGLLDKEFEYTAKKYTQGKNQIINNTPKHINMKVTPETTFLNLETNLSDHLGESFGLIGLHPCGDLGPLLLKEFADTPAIKYLCLVGCCYMKLSCNGEKFQGYPLSSFVKNIPNNHLSYESREIACHAIENYCDRLQKGQYEDLQVHAYRALLEKIIVSKWPTLKHIGLKSVKHYNKMPFETYCIKATSKAGIQLTHEEICSINWQKDLNMWKHVVIFYTLRLILAPLVESIILMDRIIFLQEKDFQCEIRAVFDPSISPRNHVLVAKKSETS